MKREIAEQWIKDLRDPRHKQTRYVLMDMESDGPSYCCLGLLCRVTLGLEPVERHDIDPVGPKMWFFGDRYDVLPMRVCEICEINSATCELPPEAHVSFDGEIRRSLVDLNDSGATFEEIADIVEKNWERL